MSSEKKPHVDPQPEHGKDDKGHGGGGRPIPTPPSSAGSNTARK